MLRINGHTPSTDHRWSPGRLTAGGLLLCVPAAAAIWLLLAAVPVFADGGPHVPDRYGSGFPWDAQFSRIGSSISQDNSTSALTGNNEGSPSRTSRISRS